MSNVIQIKHGNGVPNQKLQPYELGYSDTEEKLYIGGPKNEDQLGVAIPITTPVEEADAGGRLMYYSTDKILQASNLLILPKNNFGATFPENPVEGQVYFIIKEE